MSQQKALNIQDYFGLKQLEHKVQDPGDVCAETSLDAIFMRLEQDVLRFVQQQLQRLHRLLASDYPEGSESEEEEPSAEVLNITLDFLKRMDQEQLAQCLEDRVRVGVCRDKLKSDLQQRFSRVFEGVAKAGDSAPLTQIYTELYITEGGASEVNQEHEVRHLESASRRAAAPEKTITCEDMFKPRPHPPEPIRAVLTKGVAGVGKTVLTQKFSLDWAEGRAHQELQLLFPFTFRELNVLRDTQFSLVELLHHFFSPSKGLCSFRQLQVLFILDGLDECRLPLDFTKTRVLTDPTESASVDVLLVNLIRGSLLPSARLWITTRPAAANQIPAECVSMVTEVRGFTDPQKEQYFRKRFRDEADTIISHIKSVRSLHIMCHLPVFCWILSTVLQKLLEQTKRPELPRTLTQMYVHFLVVQTKVQNIKYHQGSGADLHWTPETREMVESLGKLAFEQLQKGNLIFYESDLSECGLDAAVASVYSGVFTQVFREEPGLYQDKVYCFIHLSVQEFLAALHVHQTFFSSGKNLLSPPHSSESPESEEPQHRSGENLLSTPHSTESPESEEPQHRSGDNLLSTPHSTESPESEEPQHRSGENLLSPPNPFLKPISAETYRAKKSLIKLTKSAERLSFLQDLDDEFEQRLAFYYSDLDNKFEQRLAFYRSAVDQALQSPNGHLDLFLRFLLGLSLPTNQRPLQGLPMQPESYWTNQRPLQGLPMQPESYWTDQRDLQDLPMQSSSWTLTRPSPQTFDRRVMYIKQKLDEEELSVDRSLNLLYCLNELNDDSLVGEIQKRMREGRLSDKDMSPAQWLALCFLLLSSDSNLEEFNLHKYHASEDVLLRLMPVVKDSNTALLNGCGLSPRCCGPLASVLSSSRLTHLDLSDNDLQDSGVELLCEGLKGAPCRLETLRLSGCLVSKRGGAALASALSSAHSHLRALDLSYNHPGPSGALLTALRDEPHCPLQSVRLKPEGPQMLRPGLQKYYAHVTLDPHTVNRFLQLSDDQRMVRSVREEQLWPHSPQRFEWPQVLSSSPLIGRCYWEAQWNGGVVDIAVCYGGIQRSGERRKCEFGIDHRSWSLRISLMGFSVRHNNIETVVPSSASSGHSQSLVDHLPRPAPSSQSFTSRSFTSRSFTSGRVGVLLDSDSLSFFDVTLGRPVLLHTFNTTFMEPVFVGFCLFNPDSSVSLVDMTQCHQGEPTGTT